MYMDRGVRTASTVSGRDTPWQHITYVLLLEGNRLVIAGGIVVGVVALVWTLVSVGLLAVGPDSTAATLFASGITSGVVTLLTIALSINQLILSRVFDSPDELADRLEGTRELRRTVEDLAGEPSTPNDPAEFLSLTAATLAGRASDLHAAIEASAWSPPDEVTAAIRDLVDYGTAIDDNVEGESAIVDALDVLLGPEYATNLTAVHHLQNEHADALSEEVRAEFEAVEELLESIAVARQFFKTLALQQDFATLSRILVYSGLVALLVSISLALVYRTDAVTVRQSALPAVVSLGVGAVVLPLAAFVAYVLRAATIAYRTVSVGPFVPPGER